MGVSGGQREGGRAPRSQAVCTAAMHNRLAGGVPGGVREHVVTKHANPQIQHAQGQDQDQRQGDGHFHHRGTSMGMHPPSAARTR